MSEIPWRPGFSRRASPERAARIPLTRDEIVQSALRITKAEGIDAVSMRRIAAEFGTGPSSLYAHVTNKDELLQLMFDEVCGYIEVPSEIDPSRWKEQVKELARSGHEALLAHNDLARSVFATIPSGPNALRASEAMLALLLAGGVPPRLAAWALDRIFLYMSADALEVSIWRGLVRDSGTDKETYLDELSEDLVGYYGTLPADTYPAITANARAFVSGNPDDRFEFGLSLIIDGLDRYVTAPTEKGQDITSSSSGAPPVA
jgi:AcrR family transcriptional regulator